MMKIILEDLRNDISDIQEKLRFDIQRIKNGEVLHINQNYTILLKEITNFQNVVQKVRFAMMKPASNDFRKKAKMLETEWRDVFDLIKQYDNQVVIYNQNNQNKLQKIEDRIQSKIYKSVETYFDYQEILMSDEEYLKEYQKKYGTLTEEEKKDILNFRYNNPISEEKMLEIMKNF